MPAGYSGTPLIKKLGIGPGAKVAVFGKPAGYEELLGELPEGASLGVKIDRATTLVHVFATEREPLLEKLKTFRVQARRSCPSLGVVAQEVGQGSDGHHRRHNTRSGGAAWATSTSKSVPFRRFGPCSSWLYAESCGQKVRPNHSVKRSAAGRPPSPVWRCCGTVIAASRGLGVLPSSPAYLER